MPDPRLPPSFLPFAALLHGEAGDLLQLDRPLWITRAPGALDVLGGPGELPGSLSLSIATGRGVFSAIQNREDKRIRIRILRPTEKGGNLDWEGEISTLYTKKGPPRSEAVLDAQFEEDEAPWMKGLMSIMIGLRRTHQLNTPKQGFDLVVWDRLPRSPGFGDWVAFATSTSLAFKASTGLDKKRVDGVRVGRAVMYGVRNVLKRTVTMTEVLTAGVSQTNCLLSVEHGVDPVMQWVPVPEHVTFAAVDSGVGIADESDPRTRAAVGAAMGLEHLNAVLRKNKLQQRGGWGQVTPAEFEGGLRSHVPTKEGGKDFLKRVRKPQIEELKDFVDPEDTYRERALAEHHVRESGRVRRFVQQLQDYARTKREDFLAEAGRGLSSSHRSLREKCSISNEQVDALCKRISDAGRRAGLFGARLCEWGNGPAVLVLAHSTAVDRLREIAQEHAAEVGGGGNVYFDIGQGGVLTGWWEGVLDAREEGETDASPAQDAQSKSS